MSSFYRDWNEIGAYHLDKDGSISFEAYINDPEFDNDDNPYGKILLHKYYNMDGPYDDNEDEE